MPFPFLKILNLFPIVLRIKFPVLSRACSGLANFTSGHSFPCLVSCNHHGLISFPSIGWALHSFWTFSHGYFLCLECFLHPCVWLMAAHPLVLRLSIASSEKAFSNSLSPFYCIVYGSPLLSLIIPLLSITVHVTPYFTFVWLDV